MKNKMRKMSFNELKDFINKVPIHNKGSKFETNFRNQAESFVQDSSKPLWSVLYDKIFNKEEEEKTRKKKHKHSKGKHTSLNPKSAHHNKHSSKYYDRISRNNSDELSSPSKSRNDSRSQNDSTFEDYYKQSNQKPVRNKRPCFKTKAERKISDIKRQANEIQK